MARNLNIHAINYIYFSALKTMAVNRHSLFWCITHFVYIALKHIRKGWGKIPKKFAEVLLVQFTLNNKRTLKPIINNLPQEVCSTIDHTKTSEPLIYLYSLFYLLHFVIDYYKTPKKDRLVMEHFFVDFFCAYGWWRFCNLLYRKNPQIKIVVLANDHSTVNSCLKILAKKYNIKTIYTQHASVSEKFPPLNFTYSFLDGKESLEKYQKVGEIAGTVFLTGSPRLDEISSVKINRSEEKTIGIAINELDDLNEIRALCFALKSNYRLIVRPHPSMPLDPLMSIAKEGIMLSNSKRETPFEYLSKIDLLIANESGIHLDAAIQGVPSILFNFSDNPIMDWYSYIKKGLIKHAKNIDDVKNFINNIPQVNTSLTQYYYAAFNTPHQYKIGRLIAEFIVALQDKKQEEFINKYFKQIDNNVFAYK